LILLPWQSGASLLPQTMKLKRTIDLYDDLRGGASHLPVRIHEISLWQDGWMRRRKWRRCAASFWPTFLSPEPKFSH